jgi:[amino group carrier protein]-lysine/ornithine hydrolase
VAVNLASGVDLLAENSGKLEPKADLAFKVISEYSPSGQERGVARIIFDYLRERKLSPGIDAVGNVICEVGRGERSVLLCGHMDTVPGELPVKLEEETIFGRGACDAKGPLLSLLFAFEKLAASVELISGKVVFAGVTEEERESTGLAELIRQGIKTNYAFFGEPGGVAKITVGYRGHLTLRLVIVTPEIHASAPKFVTNSVELLFEIYKSLKVVLGAENGSVDRVSVSLTEISSGTAHNVIPGKTTATIDIRIPLGSEVIQIRDTVEEVIRKARSNYSDATISTNYDEPTEPYRVSLNSPLVRALSRSVLRTGAKPQFITKSGTGDMNTYAKTFGVDAVTYGPGEAKLSHSSEEKVRLSEIFSCSEIIASAVKELITAEPPKEKEVMN